ncbi:jerky protein homolog-like [Uranotaenia lowii]|uniref:jerky protein homolog-like n=1 Tax=Uranotaenia lowii TaxID=190385 RepID=UPI002479E6F2|nr:jerky protein homolog-like [Uranotaenia lowii]
MRDCYRRSWSRSNSVNFEWLSPLNKRKTFKRAKYPLLDEALYIWFLQKRECHIPVSQDLLTAQATKLYLKLYNDEQFKGSRGCIVNFIKRHNIRFLQITGEKLSNNAATVDTYIEHSRSLVRHLSCQIFNADESGLYFKCITSSTFVSVNESSAPGRKGNKERVTFMSCANADGSYKLPLMLIGKSKRPRALENVRELPLYYASSKNAWMTRQLFKDWFFNEFVPKVTAFLEGANLPLTARLVFGQLFRTLQHRPA